MKMNEAEQLTPTNEYEALLHKYSKTNPGIFYGAQRCLEELCLKYPDLEVTLKHNKRQYEAAKPS